MSLKILDIGRRVRSVVAGFITAQKRWSVPRRSPIVVLYTTNHALLVPLFRGEHYEMVDLEGKEIYCSPLVLAGTAWYFMRCRSVQTAYVMAVLKWMRPAIVVTYIDNSHVFQSVARLSKGVRFLAIQNGNRLLERDHPAGSPQIYLKEFACLGNYEIDQYTKHGAGVEKFYPVGMLIDSYYRKTRPAPGNLKDFDICLVSQVRPGLEHRHTERLDAFAILVEFLGRFCRIHKHTLCVAMRQHPNRDLRQYQWERAWFEQGLGRLAQLIPNEPRGFNTYDLTDRSRVSLGMHSTSMREAFGRGNRILSCNFSGYPVYDFPVDGPWALNEPDFTMFESRLVRLLEMSESEYRSLCGDIPAYLIGYNPQIPTHEFLEHLIAEAVHEADVRRRDVSEVVARVNQ